MGKQMSRLCHEPNVGVGPFVFGMHFQEYASKYSLHVQRKYRLTKPNAQGCYGSETWVIKGFDVSLVFDSDKSSLVSISDSESLVSLGTEIIGLRVIKLGKR
jgi:hypothetical protein